VGGQSLSSQLVVLLAAGDALDSFDISLSYDPALLAPDRVDLAEHWTAATDAPPAGEPGTMEVRASTLTACAPGSTCVLATVTWKPVGEGTTSIDPTTVNLQNHGAALANVDSVPGEVQVGGKAGGAAGTPGNGTPGGTDSVAGSRSPGSSDSSLGLGLVVLLVGLIAVSGAAILAAVFVTALARRSWRWSSARPEAGPAHSDSALVGLAAEDLGPRIQEYLSQVEAFGMVASNARADSFLTEVALSGASSHAGANGHNGGNTVKSDSPIEEAEAQP
jgi:hypothetical protein